MRLLNEFLKLSTEIITVANQNREKYEGKPIRVQVNVCRYPEARENFGGLTLIDFGAHLITFSFFFSFNCFVLVLRGRASLHKH